MEKKYEGEIEIAAVREIQYWSSWILYEILAFFSLI